LCRSCRSTSQRCADAYPYGDNRHRSLARFGPAVLRPLGIGCSIVARLLCGWSWSALRSCGRCVARIDRAHLAVMVPWSCEHSRGRYPARSRVVGTAPQEDSMTEVLLQVSAR
jgi:hypothetical protein